MKRRQTLAISLLSIFLVSSVLVGLSAHSRMSILASYAKQNGIQIQQEGTSLELTAYGYPEQIRPVFDLFEYFTTENLQWRGTLPQTPGAPPGPTGQISLDLSFVEFWKEDPDNYKLMAENVEFQIKAADIIDAFIAADFVNINITFWTFGELPALNFSALLTGNVVVRLSTTLLPLPGMQFVAYEYSGERYFIHTCIIKPLHVTIDNPNEGEGVQDNVPIRATVKTAPGISVKGVQWQAHGERYCDGGMSYDVNTGVAEAIWETWRGPNGGYKICVRATGYQVGVQGPDYSAEAWTNVYVNNPPIHVTSWVWSGDHYEPIDGIEVHYWQKDKEGKFNTPFDLERRRDSKLEASGEWNIGDGRVVQFQRWVISGSDPNMGWIWEHGGTGIGIDDWMLETLYGRQLQCLYMPK